MLKQDSTDQNSSELLTNQTKDNRRSKCMFNTGKDTIVRDKIQTKKVWFKDDSYNELLDINAKDTTEETSLYWPLPTTEWDSHQIRWNIIQLMIEILINWQFQLMTSK